MKIRGLENSKKYLSKLIKSYNLQDYEEEIFLLTKETVIFRKQELEDYSKIGNTRFGGYPDLFDESIWPRDKDGKYFSFICQINLKDIAQLQNKLSPKGILYFFDGIKLNTNVKYCSSNISKLKKVNEKSNDEFYDLNPYISSYKVLPELVLTLPESSLEPIRNFEISDYYDEIKRKLDRYNGDYIASMFGYLKFFEYEIRDTTRGEKFKNDPMLLSIDSDIEEIGFCFSDVKSVVYMIKEKNLIERKFTSIFLKAV